ncbi:geranylfarnesyl diphosphate synthase [Halobacterium litoreum]|uniref:Geranylfarnesyl diphosphate synthase n=1 Tax=Halobacterium litoreum TaxID=2039234 RepID=A0ABD5NCX7_9EURY|nr:polyprenyl synthetase family protein [Halobacterium litoreum]UHH14287.1 polyprenyl synthetase family protein [Halobacterium litoreum]
MSQNAREQAVLSAVRERRELVNDAIDEDLPPKRPERLYEASRYLLKAGGKRLRPAVLLLTAEALADVELGSTDYREFPDLHGEVIDVMASAVSIEVIQSFTLIHDDIMDDDDLRRGVPAVHREYDTETAILAGDTLYSKAFEIMLRTEAPAERGLEAMRTLAETCTHICEGQALDVDFETRSDVLPDEYMEMVELKTAVLFAAASTLPGILLGADDDTVEALYNYGLRVGQAFQIHDDVLDLTVPSEKLGKQRGSDLVENKKTVVTLHAAKHGVDVGDLLDTNDPEEVTDEEIEAAVAELRDVGSIEYARDLADDLVAEGKAHLEVLPENEAHTRLEQVADYLVEREY